MLATGESKLEYYRKKYILLLYILFGFVSLFQIHVSCFADCKTYPTFDEADSRYLGCKIKVADKQWIASDISLQLCEKYCGFSSANPPTSEHNISPVLRKAAWINTLSSSSLLQSNSCRSDQGSRSSVLVEPPCQKLFADFWQLLEKTDFSLRYSLTDAFLDHLFDPLSIDPEENVEVSFVVMDGSGDYSFAIRTAEFLLSEKLAKKVTIVPHLIDEIREGIRSSAYKKGIDPETWIRAQENDYLNKLKEMIDSSAKRRLIDARLEQNRDETYRRSTRLRVSAPTFQDSIDQMSNQNLYNLRLLEYSYDNEITDKIKKSNIDSSNPRSKRFYYHTLFGSFHNTGLRKGELGIFFSDPPRGSPGLHRVNHEGLRELLVSRQRPFYFGYSAREMSKTNYIKLATEFAEQFHPNDAEVDIILPIQKFNADQIDREIQFINQNRRPEHRIDITGQGVWDDLMLHLHEKGFSEIRIYKPESSSLFPFTPISIPQSATSGRADAANRPINHKILNLIDPFPLAHSDMMELVALSENPVLCTGDQSLGEVLSLSKIPMYEMRGHKMKLAEALVLSFDRFPKLKTLIDCSIAPEYPKKLPSPSYRAHAAFYKNNRVTIDSDLKTALEDLRENYDLSVRMKSKVKRAIFSQKHPNLRKKLDSIEKIVLENEYHRKDLTLWSDFGIPGSGDPSSISEFKKALSSVVESMNLTTDGKICTDYSKMMGSLTKIYDEHGVSSGN